MSDPPFDTTSPRDLIERELRRIASACERIKKSEGTIARALRELAPQVGDPPPPQRRKPTEDDLRAAREDLRRAGYVPKITKK
jgi:hypothetical protein